MSPEPAEISALIPSLLDPTRLSIVSLLAAVQWAEFGYVRDAVGLTDSALSKQVTTLTKPGYVNIDKGYVGKRPRTWLRLSDEGRAALRRHIEALTNIADNAYTQGERHPARIGTPPLGDDGQPQPTPEQDPFPDRTQ